MAKQVMPSKGVPFPIDDWQSVMIRGLEILNANNWFPMLTLMVGNPGETDEDVKATLDLIYEMERRGLFGFLVPSVFTPARGDPDGARHRRHGDAQPDAAAVAAHPPLLEDEHAPRALQLVGAAVVQDRRRRALGDAACARPTAGTSPGR